MGKSYKKEGKTEVYPFWYVEDIIGMMDFFKMKEMWHWYLVFNLGLFLGRRVSDTLSFKWSDFFYENGIHILHHSSNSYSFHNHTYQNSSL